MNDLPWGPEEEAWLTREGLGLDDGRRRLLARYRMLLEEANTRLNLTRLEGPEEFLRKHALDALAFWALVPDSWRQGPGTLLDVGTGGGLPGIPMLLVLEGWRGVLLDATRKKVEAVQGFLEPLGLSERALAVWGRVEDDRCLEGETYRLVVARAVKDLSLLLRWCGPRVAPGGRLIVSKGPRGPEELERAKDTMREAGLVLASLKEIALPHESGNRILMAFERPTTRISG
ncbi:MAG: 16S rRNA (guanine(527)-N(7))-methyltransferase RsmG [Candidatus Sericytochromatia bacterium]|nr:16S rRNA (guanine(527)-N(7))-methyltransferase RsmG [Candidatus Sericytochromatia bacterium]